MGGTHFSGPLFHMGGAMAAIGAPHTEVFYVNGVTWANGFSTGNDGNSGESPDAPFMTMTKAVDSCTNEANSVIYVLDYYQPTGETWPISIDKALLNIIGVGSQFSPLTKWICMYAPGSTACIDVVADCVYIEGIGFFPNASYAGVTVDEGKKMLHLHECYFAQGTYGVHATSGDWGFNLAITNSFFLSALGTGGVYINDDPPGVYIKDCLFDRHTGVSIDIEQGAYHYILDNRFAMKAATEGLAITLGASVSRAFVDGNHAAYGEESSAITPYKDEGTVTTNNWGTNYYGHLVDTPA